MLSVSDLICSGSITVADLIPGTFTGGEGGRDAPPSRLTGAPAAFRREQEADFLRAVVARRKERWACD